MKARRGGEERFGKGLGKEGDSIVLRGRQVDARSEAAVAVEPVSTSVPVEGSYLRIKLHHHLWEREVPVADWIDSDDPIKRHEADSLQPGPFGFRYILIPEGVGEVLMTLMRVSERMGREMRPGRLRHEVVLGKVVPSSLVHGYPGVVLALDHRKMAGMTERVKLAQQPPMSLGGLVIWLLWISVIARISEQ
jgi:hypothetical protein